MKYILGILIIAFSIISCKTKQVIVEKPVPIIDTRELRITNIKYDSVYIHDSVNVYIRGDTVYKDKIKTIFKEKYFKDTIKSTDTIEKPIYITNTIEKQRDTPKSNIFKYVSGLLGLIVGILILMLKLRK